MRHAVCLLALASSASASIYAENFEVNPAAAWTINGGPSDETANFFFDYSTVGIPPAPSGAGTRGMKLQANLSNGIFGGFSVSPTGLNISGDFTLSFDWWANFNGPFPSGGSGAVNLSTFGVGTAGITPQWPGGIQDSVWFAATGDGNSASDWRAYSSAAPVGYTSGNAVYAAASTNHTDPYYAQFGLNTAPAPQLLLYPQQTGVTNVGSAGLEWHQVEIASIGNTITWTVDGLLIATINRATVTLGGGNIFFGHSDVNATSSTDPNDAALLFTLIDNIRVEAAPACPGDVNGDGSTDAGDFVILAGNFGAPVPANTAGDLNGDGVVDAADFVILAGDFGCTGP